MEGDVRLNRKNIESVIFLIIFFGIFGSVAHIMGVRNMLTTVMATAHDLLLNTVFFILSITCSTFSWMVPVDPNRKNMQTYAYLERFTKFIKRKPTSGHDHE